MPADALAYAGSESDRFIGELVEFLQKIIHPIIVGA
jgi:hypothetical protein